jgi:catechol 2,3-dioxygenase-like lactoylglutathione lyase family enzyme
VFDHVTIRVADRAASGPFYETVLSTLGTLQTYGDEHFAEWADFSIVGSRDGAVTRGLHIGFAAPTRAHVDAFWQAGVEAGYGDDGPPGLRPEYRADYYGAFLRDPDGNSAEAVHHGALGGRTIDHLWIRVADVDASRSFYETIAPHAGFRLKHAELPSPRRAHFAGEGGSFSVVDGPATEHMHVAFPSADDASVDAFHRAATAAGYRDNGPPGERPIYHRGYYGAFVLDPDGNNVEVVNHNR